MTSKRSGDGFLRCDDGHVRWGIYGAAGVVFVANLAAAPLVMLQKRSAFAHEGGTWSCAGGALDLDEGVLEGALREASEEVGDVPVGYRLLGEYVFAPASDWSYTTIVVEVPEKFGSSMNFETDDVAWVPIGRVEDLALHAGFSAAWPHIVRIIADSSTAT